MNREDTRHPCAVRLSCSPRAPEHVTALGHPREELPLPRLPLPLVVGASLRPVTLLADALQTRSLRRITPERLPRKRPITRRAVAPRISTARSRASGGLKKRRSVASALLLRTTFGGMGSYQTRDQISCAVIGRGGLAVL